MDRHHRNYELLGTKPGDTWQKLRNNYKAAVHKWHPDRFTSSNTERGVAEEKTKEINRAYQELQEHYLRHGSLPLDEPLQDPPRHENSVTPPPPSHRDSAAASAANQRTREPAGNRAHKKASGSHFRVSLVLIGLLFAGYFFLAPDEHAVPVENHSANPSITAPNTQIDTDKTPRMTTRGNFTTGSTLGEVHSIQGIPTRIDGETWYYGDAKVFFKNGKVSHWVNSADQRLLAQSMEESPVHEATARYFGKGSTKAEVRALQGAPIHETEKVWDYGLSRVYFDKDKVAGWSESPLELLHIKR